MEMLIVLGVVLVGIFLVVAILAGKERSFLKNANRYVGPVTGTVVERETAVHATNRLVYANVRLEIAYTWDGVTYTSSPEHELGFDSYTIGQEIPIFVDPTMPRSILVEEELAIAKRAYNGYVFVLVLVVLLPVLLLLWIASLKR